MSFYSVLVENGLRPLSEKITESENSLEIYIFDDFKFVFAPEGDDWDSADNIYTYMVSKKFGVLMGLLFNDSDGEYDKGTLPHSYLARKFRKDKQGSFAMGLAELNYTGNDYELTNGSVTYEIGDLIRSFRDVDSFVALYELMYRSGLQDFIVYIEGAWVYLFVCYEAGLRRDEIENSMVMDNIRCRLKKEFDSEMFDYFEEKYNALS